MRKIFTYFILKRFTQLKQVNLQSVFTNTIESKSDLVVFLIETDENSIIQDLSKLLCINDIFFIEFLAGNGTRRRNRGVSRTNRWL